MRSYAQNASPIFKHITTSDGLINNKVDIMYQDHEGFIWLGTMIGLQRWDGTKFKNFFADVRDTSALQSDWISAIFEDSKNRLWIGNDNGGIYLLNRQTGKFYNYNAHANASNIINGIWQIEEDKRGIIWIAGHAGIFKLNETTNQFENVTESLGVGKISNTGSLTFDNDNNIWLNTTTGVKYYNQKEKKLYSSSYNPAKNPIFNMNNLGGKILIHKNNLWYTGYKVFYKYNLLTKAIKKYEISVQKSIEGGAEVSKEIIGGLFCLKNGTMLIPLCGSGIVTFESEKENYSSFYIDNINPTGYHGIENSGNYPYILEDKDKNILISNDAGINISAPSNEKFNIHPYNINSKKKYSNLSASDFLEMPNGDFFISLYHLKGGIVQLDSNFKYKKHYNILKNETNYEKANDVIWTLFNDGEGSIIAPNQMKNILKINLKTNKLTEVKDSVLGGPINIIKKDETGNTWMGHWSKGLVKKDRISSKYSFYTNFLESDSTYKKRVFCLLLEENKIWVGTSQNGLQLFDKNQERFTTVFIPDQKNPTSISSNCINEIIRYNSDTLILATLMGVNIFNTQTKQFTTLTTKQGLPDNLVLSVIKDNLGFVWIRCYGNEICRINMHDLSITNYGINDGIADYQLTSKFYKQKNGNILIGASENFISFNPNKFAISAAPKNVTITGMHVFEKELAIDSLLNKKKPIYLSHKENSMRIDFASLEYWNPEGIEYFYKLNGVDKDWIKADKNQQAIYNQLNNGKYIFAIKCSNKDGICCESITKLIIIINPPFWKTWWFILLSIFLTILAIVSLVKWREKNIKSIEAEKLKVQELNAAQYKNKLELEQIINYFSSSLIDKHTVDGVLWDVAKNLIGQLGFVDCMIYLWNADKTKMLQRAGHGPKDSIEEITEHLFDVAPGQGVVGFVMQTKEAVLIADTSKDSRYRPDDIVRLSEITVPIIYDNELIGVLDSEHPDKNFYTEKHLQILTTIAALVGNKIKSIEAEENLQTSKIEIYKMEVLLAKAKLEALRSQMNPHFIFNSLNAIQECIVTGNVDAAYEYLSKFSKLQRLVLNNSAKELIPLGTEVEMLQLYLSLESLRFSKSFTYKIDIDKAIDKEEILIPSLITQPYVENSIWHGLRNMEGEKRLIIDFTEVGGKLVITIDDNGIGRVEAAKIKAAKIAVTKYTSMGSILSADRILLLNQQYKTTITLNYIDKKDIKGNTIGTSVTIILPNNLSIS